MASDKTVVGGFADDVDMVSDKPMASEIERPTWRWRSDKAHETIGDAAELIASRYCDEDDTFNDEVRRLKVAISDVVDQASFYTQAQMDAAIATERVETLRNVVEILQGLRSGLRSKEMVIKDLEAAIRNQSREESR